MTVHGDPPSKPNERQYTNFLVDSPLIEEVSITFIITLCYCACAAGEIGVRVFWIVRRVIRCIQKISDDCAQWQCVWLCWVWFQQFSHWISFMRRRRCMFCLFFSCCSICGCCMELSVWCALHCALCSLTEFSSVPGRRGGGAVPPELPSGIHAKCINPVRIFICRWGWGQRTRPDPLNTCR